jgi:2-polyprenyl-6-methoxyphenol hydroxylase-like FAD-dependent oxidoreductase
MTSVDILIVGAGPVGLMCAYLAQRCGFFFVILDKSEGPLQKGRADALNARTLQLLEIANLFPDLYPIGKPCHTSSIWEKGRFTSRQSSWWTSLEGCFHKHFLMIGQAHVEQLLVKRLNEMDTFVRRQTQVCQMELGEESCVSLLSTGECIQSRYVIAHIPQRADIFKGLS